MIGTLEDQVHVLLGLHHCEEDKSTRLTDTLPELKEAKPKNQRCIPLLLVSFLLKTAI